jgi:hypothetical protein
MEREEPAEREGGGFVSAGEIRSLRPDSFSIRSTIIGTERLPVFIARGDEDFDWLERMIIERRYYEDGGIWSLGINDDKRAIAEIIALFTRRRALEMGCASGAVMKCLRDLGVSSEGIEISADAISKSFPEIRTNIFHGDLEDFSSPNTFDLVFGLDVFEHLNPVKLDRYIARLAGLLEEPGFLFCNIPAFGHDPIYGSIFPVYLRDWYVDLSAGQNFRTIHVDDRGFPLHGHLIWADWLWWMSRFTAHGLRREDGLEQLVHARYDPLYNTLGKARQSFFVFSKGLPDTRRREVEEKIICTPSAILERFNRQNDPRETLLADPRIFSHGWHALENGNGRPFRWSRAKAFLDLSGHKGRRVSFTVSSAYPAIESSPVTVLLSSHPGHRSVKQVQLRSHRRTAIDIVLPPDAPVLEISVSPSWIPAMMLPNNGDGRELGVSVGDLRFSR